MQTQQTPTLNQPAGAQAVRRILDLTSQLGLFYDPATGQHSLRALQDLPQGAQLHTFGAREYVAQPTYLSVQVGDAAHIHLFPEFLQYINHSCAPNTFFDTVQGVVVALRDIAPQEEITFFYPSTEWSMTQPFTCLCGAAACLGRIQGAAYLNRQALRQYRFAGHIQQRLRRTLGAYWKTTRELTRPSAPLRLAQAAA